MAYPYKDKKILITGATGLIGGAVARRLLKDGCQVRVLARTPAKAGNLQRMGAEVVQGDLLDTASLQAAVAGCQVVVHCAGSVDVYASWEYYRALNVASVTRLGQACLAAGVERLFFTSSVVVYGLYTGPEKDEASPHVISGERYTDTKIEGEQALCEMIAQGLPAVVLQPTQVYGPGDTAWTLKPFKLIKKNLLTMPQGGRGVIQPIFIDDLAEGYLAAIEKGTVGETYILAGERPVELRHFFKYYAGMQGKKWIPAAPRFVAMIGAALFEGLAKLTGSDPIFTRDNVRVTTMNTSYIGAKAARELDFTPKVSLDDGMQRSAEWLRAEGHL